MGYTHYWSQQRDYTEAEWQQISATIKAIIAASDVAVASEYDRPNDAPEFTDDHILFNGVGDDGHETFGFMRKGEDDFQFCKTARKPYDEIVVACLIAASEMGVITWSSDGEGEPDYLTDGSALLREIQKETLELLRYTCPCGHNWDVPVEERYGDVDDDCSECGTSCSPVRIEVQVKSSTHVVIEEIES